MTQWQQLARDRFPGYTVEGDGKFALVMADFHHVCLSEFAFLLKVLPGYEQYRRIVELKPVQKVNKLRRSTSDPSRQERD
jgi:hypothetical protein